MRSVTECMKEIEYDMVDFLVYSVKTTFDACTHSVSRVLFLTEGGAWGHINFRALSSNISTVRVPKLDVLF